MSGPQWAGPQKRCTKEFCDSLLLQVIARYGPEPFSIRYWASKFDKAPSVRKPTSHWVPSSGVQEKHDIARRWPWFFSKSLQRLYTSHAIVSYLLKKSSLLPMVSFVWRFLFLLSCQLFGTAQTRKVITIHEKCLGKAMSEITLQGV